MKAKRLIPIAIAALMSVVAWSGSALARPTPPQDGDAAVESRKKEVKEVKDFVLAFCKATKDKDEAALGNLLSEDYTFTAPSGVVQHKQDTIAAAMTVSYGYNPDLCTEDYTTNCYTVRILADTDRPQSMSRRTAIMTANFTITGVVNGHPITGTFQATQTLVKQASGRWLAVSGSMTKGTTKGYSGSTAADK